MSSTSRSPSLALGFLALGLIVISVGALLYWLYHTIGTIKPETATLLVGVFGLAGSLIGVSISKYYERQAQIEQSQRERKAKMYEDFLGFVFRFVFSDKTGQPKLTELESIKGFADFTERVMVWGSNDVIKAFADFKGNLPKDQTPIDRLATIEELFFAIRADLGHSRGSFKRGDLLRLFVNDIDGVLASNRPPSHSLAGSPSATL